MRRKLAAGVGLMALPLFSCAESPTPIAEAHGLKLAVAPLSLPGIDFACYDVRVTAGSGETLETVWSQGDPTLTYLGHDQSLPGDPDNAQVGAKDAGTLCSSVYGNKAGGDITYIGTCDSTNDSAAADGVQNDVTLWVDGLYVETQLNGLVELGEWQDPCGDAGCTLSFDCLENRDTLVEFSFTLMRDANQGFFDVAVNFEDIFCSAKVDCSYDAAGNQPIELLFDANGDRQQTAVAAFACTAGAGEGEGTVLHMNGVRVECGDNGAAPLLQLTLATTCVSDGQVLGTHFVQSQTGIDMTPLVWDVDGTYAVLPTRPGDVGGLAMTRLDDTHVAGFVATGPFMGGGVEGQLAIWEKSGGAWALLQVAAGPALQYDIFEGFECFGTLADGFCLGQGGTNQNVLWRLTGGVAAAGVVIPYPTTPGLTECYDVEVEGNGSYVAASRTCSDGTNNINFALDLTTLSYTALPVPTGTAAVPAPTSVAAGWAHPYGGGGYIGAVQFNDAVTGWVSRIIHWTESGGVYTAAEVSADHLYLGDESEGAVFVYDALTNNGRVFRFAGGTWDQWSDFDSPTSTTPTVQFEGYIAAFGTNGMVFGRYRDTDADLFMPFYALLSAPGGTTTLVPMPLPAGFTPTVDANFAGDLSNTTTRRVGYGWEDASLVYVAWELTAAGVGAWQQVGLSQGVGDLVGPWANWGGFSSTHEALRRPSCTNLFGNDPVADANAVPAVWAWPAATNGDLVAPNYYSAPSAGGGGGTFEVVDLDPTVQGNGFIPPLTGATVWQYAVYRGEEQLTCDGQPCNKVYWNTAIGFDPNVADCRLVMQATAASAPGLDGNSTPANGAAYPVIEVDVPLTGATGGVVCTQNPLNGAGSGVTTTYTSPGTSLHFCYEFDGATATAEEGCTWTSPSATPVACVPVDCNDQNDTTDDTCVDGVCQHIDNTTNK